ncbi:gp53-like domain-containing protein [Citrobacter braakii]|uniref:gp53-like domain-containing protein n=1 Tax=Citrobacter braakii TaxID=57706 RepID=UPI002FDC2377
MYHVDNSTGVPVMPQPSPVTSETELFFTEGGNGVPPTFPGPDWFNIIQSELINILRAAGLDPDKMDNTQILAALKKLFLSRSNPFGDIKADGAAAIATALSNLGLGELALAGTITGVFDTNGYLKIPVIIGGAKRTLIVQWGNAGNAASATTETFYPIPFPNKVFQVIACGFQVGGNQQAYVTVNSSNPLNRFVWNGFYANGGQAPILSTVANQVGCQYIVIGW